MTEGWNTGWSLLFLITSLAFGQSRAAAQQPLPIKSALGAAGVGGCAAFPLPVVSASISPNADLEARQLVDDAQEAALSGDHAAARDAFARAAALAPTNARIAYYLGREREALGESTQAVREYCRYLALTPTAPDGDEVRGRIVRLTPATDLAKVDEAKAAFNSGVSLLRRRQYEAADSVFAGVVRQVPAAPEPYFNRALSRAARGNRALAMQDFEKYLELLPQAGDRTVVRGTMARLPDGVYSPGSAFASGLLIPGLGQMKTGRPVRGVLTLALAGGAIGWGLMAKNSFTPQQFTDPFGNPYVDTIPSSSRPNAAVGLSIAGALWLGSALEAMGFAKRSRSRAEAIIALPNAPRATPSERGVGIRALHRNAVGIGLSLSFGPSTPSSPRPASYGGTPVRVDGDRRR